MISPLLPPCFHAVGQVANLRRVAYPPVGAREMLHPVPVGNLRAGCHPAPQTLLTVATVICCLLVGCAQVKPLPVIGEVPQFQLTLQTDQPFDSQTLDGHIWVANFIYTTCDGPCPMMSHQMRGIQNSTSGTPQLKLVSFTVDPAHDTPPVLSKYAAHFKADPDRWYFLTGEMGRLNELGIGAFRLNSVDGSLSHSTRFVLVDGKRRIRGYYLSNDDGFPKKLLHDIRQLQSER
jgi:protein SCO1/2